MKQLVWRTIMVCFAVFAVITWKTDAQAASKPGNIKYIKVVTDNKTTGLSKAQKKKGYKRVQLYWYKSKGATRYRIYYSYSQNGTYKRATKNLYVKGAKSGNYRKYTFAFTKKKKVYLKVVPYNGSTKGNISDYASCKVGSTSYNASKVSYSKYYKTLYIGTKGKYAAKANRGLSRSVRFISSNTSIATVSKNSGVVTPKKAGKVKIYAVAHNGVKSYVTVTVKKSTSGREDGVPTAPVLNYVTFRPQELSATLVEARISFKTVKGSKYQVLRKTTGSYTTIGTITATGSSKVYLDKTASKNTRYTYTVREIEKNGTYTVYGKYDTDGIQTLLPVENVEIDQQNLKTTIKWSSVEDAQKYTIHRKVGKGGDYRALTNVSSGLTWDDVYYDTLSTEEEKEYACATNFVDPSINPFVYQVRAVRETKDDNGNKKYSYSYYNKDGYYKLPQPAIIGYDSGTLYFGKSSCSDGYQIMKGHKEGNHIVWTQVMTASNVSGTKQSVKVSYDAANPYFTVIAYSDRNGETILSDYDEGFYIDPALKAKYSGKKILFLGNSITYGSPYKGKTTRHVFSYPYRIGQLLGVQYFNPSIPGSTYSLVDGVVDPKVGTSYKGQGGRFRITRDVVDKMLDRDVTELSGDDDLGITKESYPATGHVFAAYDVVIMAAGTNDYGDSNDMTTVEGNLDNEDQHNMTGALNYIVSEIDKASKERIEDDKDPIKVVFLDFFYSDRLYDYSKKTNRFTTENKIGLTLTDYQNQYDKLIARYEDHYESEIYTTKDGEDSSRILQIYHFKTNDYDFINQENCPYTSSDNLHMSRATYGKIGNELTEYLLENVLEDKIKDVNP